MKRLLYIFIIILEIVFYFVIINIDIPCIFKLIFKIPCPACGLTHAFLSLFNLDIIGAVKYNILIIPIFIFILLINYYLIQDIVLNKNNTIFFINKVFKYYKIIILLLILSEIYNLFIVF